LSPNKDAESSINIALEVRFLPGPLCLISLPFVAVMVLRQFLNCYASYFRSHWGTETRGEAEEDTDATKMDEDENCLLSLAIFWCFLTPEVGVGNIAAGAVVWFRLPGE
jgi:hypothetical protein